MIGKLREGNQFILQIKWHFLVTFEHGTCLHFIQSIGYSACFQVDPLSWVMSLLWVFQRLHCPPLHYVLVSAWSSQCFQEFGHVAQCSKGKSCWDFVSAVKTLCQLTLSQSYGYVILKFKKFVPSFVSFMWDSSWDSFDKTIPANFNSSSEN